MSQPQPIPDYAVKAQLLSQAGHVGLWAVMIR